MTAAVITFCTITIIAWVTHISAMSLAEIKFTGEGSRECTATVCTYKFSKYFTADICSKAKRFGTWGPTVYGKSCWNGEGISYYDGYITRSFYQKGDTSNLNGNINGDNTINSYTAISVSKESDGKYFVILMDTPFECHAGDNILTKIDGIYWFMIACEQNNDFYSNKYLAIFNENDIELLGDKDKIRANGKTFSHFVSQQNVIMRSHSDVSLDFISRIHGVENEYITGNYKYKSNTDGLNLRRIKIDPDNYWEITPLERYTVSSSAALKVQGAAKWSDSSGDYMLLSTNTIIRRCYIKEKSDGSHDINYCYKHCKLKINKDSAVALQGAEFDDNGRYFVGSEWGEKHDSRFFMINDIINMEDQEQYCETYDFENAKPNARIEEPFAIEESTEHNFNYYGGDNAKKFVSISPWIICIGIVLILLLLFNLWLMCSRYKNRDKNGNKNRDAISKFWYT